MTYQLPPLPYPLDALEPAISKETLGFHHGKHHKTYVDKLNEALSKHPELQDQPIEQLLRNLATVPADIRQAVRNHGGGHHNHSLFWATMCPGGAAPAGDIARRLDATFGGLAAFKEKFEKDAAGLFGSGWTFLVHNPQQDTIEIVSLQNQDSPLSAGRTPLMLCDLWEHAYYLQFKNLRPDWVKAWWGVLDWNAVAKNLEAARRQ
jgi:superoxide dismutase, Fe-Mn family